MNYLEVYTNAFNTPTYSAEHHLQYDYIVKNVLKLNSVSNNIVDVGSGRGFVIKMLNNISNNLINYSITSVDLKQFHNERCNQFIECNLSVDTDRNKLLMSKYDILICTDVFEHLDKSYIESVIHMCSKIAPICILGIANHSDILNSIELHTIQENDIWWETYLNKYFEIMNKETHFYGRLYMYVCKSKYFL